MSDTEWRSGPPPSIGWWPTAIIRGDWMSELDIRWWDGKRWSVRAIHDDARRGVLNKVAKIPTQFHNSEILWRPRPSNWLPRSFT